MANEYSSVLQILSKDINDINIGLEEDVESLKKLINEGTEHKNNQKPER